MLLYHYITFEQVLVVEPVLQIHSQRSGVCLLEAGMNELTMQDQYVLFNLIFSYPMKYTFYILLQIMFTDVDTINTFKKIYLFNVKDTFFNLNFKSSQSVLVFQRSR